MAEKNITIRQLNSDENYDKLYPTTIAEQLKLSANTSALFGTSVKDADAAMGVICDQLADLKFVTIKVVDRTGEGLSGVSIQGLAGTPKTGNDGTVRGVWISDPVTAVSPYVDLASISDNAESYAGTFNVLTLTLPSIANNTVIDYTSSTTVRFSRNVKNVDVCCVGGGGGGVIPSDSTGSLDGGGGTGGGGGGIVNAIGYYPPINTDIPIIVGTGGAIETGWYYIKNSGVRAGNSSFGDIIAYGGTSGYYTEEGTGRFVYHGGVEGSSGSGNGGSYSSTVVTSEDGNGKANTTLSKFNEGTIFYSGGGGVGYYNPVQDAYGQEYYQSFSGGNPNGADGGEVRKRSSTGYDITNAKTAGIGGGGGGGYYQSATDYADASAGGRGLVSVRIHLY